jgi:hypothetical protein
MTMTNLSLKTPHPSDREPREELILTHVDPIPTYEETMRLPRPNALQILGATFGGVVVTPAIQALIIGDSDTLTLDMRTLWRSLEPDPAPSKIKTLTVLYRFDDDPELDTRLLSIPEDAQPHKVTISRHASVGQNGQRRDPRMLHGKLERAWRAGPQGEVDILAVVYGPKRVEAPGVLSVLANYFEGRWGQVRMTNRFFEGDTWPYHRKSWTVYFRFVGSRRVQVVTGWEDGALEVPWTRG